MNKLIYFLLRTFAGNAFADPQFPAPKLIKHFILQKILRRNAHVPWPVHPSTIIKAPEKINRGTRCPGMAPFCYLDGRNGIIIGENTWIGPRVSIISMNHDLCNYSKYIPSNPIIIGKNCWIGAGAIITAGVNLGDHTVVAAGAVVTKNFSGNVLIAGVPARVIRELEGYQADGGRP
ncbi:MAG: acyltransferase [Calditrichaeota bacterium]|nr:MAG: acyltransferase [Calditrichota bacterium]